ncbi:MAG TPA: GGDEF domain-containing protein, partial [Rhodocyclaceae bacterium]|nr:GGDEF domain-containing protein [Rhodocyclaceae bacterium]
DLKQKALLTVAGIAGAVTLFSGLLILLARRLLRPISDTAQAVEHAVHRALEGDFKAHVEQQTKDEIGQIASDMNRLLGFLDNGLNRIGTNVARLTQRTPAPDENLLTATIDMVDSLTRAAHFKQAIEEDETKAEIYQRLAVTLENEFQIKEYSLYEVGSGNNQLRPIIVNGTLSADCRWCDPQILARPEACRARRTGHTADGVLSSGICYAFQPPADGGERRHICLPMIQSGTVGSVVQLVAKPEDAERLSKLLPYVKVYLQETAPVLETKRLMETLREANLHDPMTGLSNRRFLEEFMATLLASAQRRQIHLAVLMLDLDYFKMVNDTYGHDAGDTVLKAVAKVFQQSVRASDLVIRYGGEEFLIILQDAESDAAERVAENIRIAVENLKIQVAGTVLQKTISIGIADFPSDSDTFWQAVKFADVALYQAKETGRNKVVRFRPDMWHDKKEY